MIDQHYLQCSFFSSDKDRRTHVKKPQGQRLYRIGEAARMLNLQTSVLRFWEGEFSELSPVRTPKGQRMYTEQDMDVLRRIRSLLHEHGMTIEGARRILAGGVVPEASASAPQGLPAQQASAEAAGLLRSAVEELLQIRAVLVGSDRGNVR